MGGRTLTVEIKIKRPDGTISNDERTAMMPLIPIRLALNEAQATARDEANNVKLTAACAAAFGLCWPDGAWPSFRDCGHDVIDFGMQVQDWAYRNGWDVGVLVRQGGGALNAMIEDLADIIGVRVEEEKAFSEGPAVIDTI